jgi:cardiolipin synthase C
MPLRRVVLVLGAGLASACSYEPFSVFAERVQGEPSHALPVAEDGTPLDAVVAPLLAERPGQTGLMLLDGGLDAFAARALTARHAGRSLDLQYYIWRGDLTGRLLAGEIIKAADRGVRVRLLLDDINAYGYDRTHLALDAHPNIAVRLFNPALTREGAIGRAVEMLLRAVTFTRRMHNKAWIADGRVAVVGGRNVGDAYFDADRSANFRDLDLLMLGDAVRETEVVFDAFWNSKAVIPISALGESREADLPALRKELAALATGDQARPYLDWVAEDETVRRMVSGEARLHWTADAQVVSDPPEKVIEAGQEGWLMTVIRPLLLSATDDLEIISPYFIPGEAGTSQLAALAGAGTQVSILTNSLAATDVVAVHGAYANYREPLVAGGVRLFELKPYDAESDVSLFGSSSASLHTKSFTVDDRLGFIGSMNFDPRSISLNSEMGVVFEHAELVRQVREAFADETAPQKSWRVRLDEGDIVWQDGAGAARNILRTEPQSGIWRRMTATVIGWLPIESQL